jgi:putative addiction module component (TIGR02574 family)
MSIDIQSVRDAALQLSEQDRVFLVGEILDSLPVESEMSEEELLAELDRRAADGLVGAVPWEQVREMR